MIIFDLDGTLTDCEHRRHHVSGPKKDWPAFHAACIQDRPRQPIIEIARALIQQRRGEVEVWSGRDEAYRELTEQWYRRWAPHLLDVRTRMRPTGDHRPDEQLKGNWLALQLAAGWHIELVFDDRDRMVAFWRSKGILCAQVAPGDF